MPDDQIPAQAPGGNNVSSVSPKQKNTLMGILAYLGILVIIPYVMAKDEPFVKFHIKQGLVLLAIEVVIWVLSMLLWQLWWVFNIASLAVLAFIILGIVNVVQGKEQELPFVGKFSENIPV